jgi:signal transduction histidine kinase
VRRLLWPVIAVGGLAAEAAAFGVDAPADWIPDLLTGWAVAASGLIAWERRPDSLVGPLLAASGGLWFAGTVNADLTYLYRGPLLHATLTLPDGRPQGRLQLLTVAASYAAAAAVPVWRSEAATVVLAAALVASAEVQRRAAVGLRRRELTYALRSTGGLAALLAFTALLRLAVPTPTADDITLLIFEAGLVALAVTVAGWVSRRPWLTPGATDLVVDLADTRSAAVREQLARALGDPTLEVAFRPPAGATYVDAAGRAVALPEAGSRRVSIVEEHGRTVAALIHDAAVLEDPALTMALAEAAALASSNAGLQAEVRDQLAELEASRRRLLSAADDERRRLEQRLRETTERRLTELLPEVRGAERAASDPEQRQALIRIREQLVQSLADVRRLAAGLHPRELSEGGLAAALGALAARSPVEVDLEVALPDVLSPEVERAAYFVCSESLTNVVKYAAASRAVVAVAASGGRLRVEIADDGRGGASLDRGSGLRGLADRVEALRGRLLVESQPGEGTRVVCELPLRGCS